MNKRIVLLIGILAVVAIGLVAWTSLREETPGQAVEDEKAVEAVEEGVSGEETPAEFQDNLNGAFEDLEAIES